MQPGWRVQLSCITKSKRHGRFVNRKFFHADKVEVPHCLDYCHEHFSGRAVFLFSSRKYLADINDDHLQAILDLRQCSTHTVVCQNRCPNQSTFEVFECLLFSLVPPPLGEVPPATTSPADGCSSRRQSQS